MFPENCEELMECNEVLYFSSPLYEIILNKKTNDFLHLMMALEPENYEYWESRPNNLKFPWEEFPWGNRVRKYEFKMSGIEETILTSFKNSILSEPAKLLTLEQYGFLKENSSVFMRGSAFSRRLHKWGIRVLDSTNKVYDAKGKFFKKYRGAKWIIGVLIGFAAAGTAFSSHDDLAKVIGLGDPIFLIMDP
jgi:hypothetical protein